ncbi:MAG TPA: SURF1 family protein [Rhodanobacter sp.]|nr:SURF1 family protein [Rhodanobacter sp.]
MSPAPRNDPAASRMMRSPFARLAWLLLAVALCIGFILLGNWQVHRLGWKRQLIHDVSTRVHATPVAAPGPAQWPPIAAGRQQYLHVHLRGRFLDVAQTLVHGASEHGYGFWAIAPLRTDSGFIVLVNRGYMPANLPGTPAYAKATPPTGEVSLTGLLRRSESGGGFLRSNRPAKGQWYSRDVPAIASASGLPLTQVAPYFVDVDAAPAGDGAPHWPLGGQTVIRFPNHHLAYLITWYLLALGMAAVAVCMVGEDIRLRRLARHAPDGIARGAGLPDESNGS